MTTRSLLAFFLLASTSSASTIYVNSNLGSGANNGATWADAYRGFNGLQAALAAAVPGDQIWVRWGNYKPTLTTSRTVSFQLRNDVELYGRFLGTETSLAERNLNAPVQSVLLGDLQVNDPSGQYDDNSYHVVDATGTNSTAVLDGFTIQGGSADGVGPNQDRGGGILCVAGASPTVRNCRFFHNRSALGGGAGYVEASGPTFTRCNVEGNVGGASGGAFVCSTNVLTAFDRCYFTGNTAVRAGALELSGASTASLTNCLFRDNAATGAGGGGALFLSASNADIRLSTFVANTAAIQGAGGILSTGSTLLLSNSILWANSGVGAAMGAVNQIEPTTLPGVSFTCVQGGFAGTGNLSADPQFVSLDARNLDLTVLSPCVDAGNNGAVPAGTVFSIFGGPRFTDEPTVADTGLGVAPIVDMGCFELLLPTVTAFCFGDGTGASCPCGNNAPPLSQTGCLNSVGSGGRLQSTGYARFTTDTLVLIGSGMTSSNCIYFQGTTQLNGGLGSVFGDSLLCVDGALVRLATKLNSNGASQYPAAGDPSVSVAGGLLSAGDDQTYQVWYHDSAAFCQSDTFSLTSALRVIWAW